MNTLLTQLAQTDQLTDRRKDPNNQAVVMLLNNLTKQVSDLQQRVGELQRTDTSNVILTQDMVEQAVDHAMGKAFPYGDSDAHRKVHEAYIREAEDRAKLYATLRTEVAKWGLLGLVAWAGLALWHAFLKGPT